VATANTSAAFTFSQSVSGPVTISGPVTVSGPVTHLSEVAQASCLCPPAASAVNYVHYAEVCCVAPGQPTPARL
jgi:hypothetical protein